MVTSDTHATGHVFYRQAGHLHPAAERGEGVYLHDADGKRYLDASGGALVVNVGHGVREIADAIGRQAAQMAYAHPTMFTSRPMEAYAEALAAVTPLPDVRFFPMCSGSEAVETAIKLARQVQMERGRAGRHLIVARWQSYHGATLGALAMTGKPKMRRPFQPMLPETPHIPPPYCYRCPYGLTHPDCGMRCAEALADEIKRVGAENVAAFLAESVSGATLGAVVPPPAYWPRIREICDEYGLLLIIDEVMAGFGRTGRWFGFQHWDVEPDIVTMGKGTTGGYFPLSITALRGEWADVILNGSGNFVHGGTFSHHAVGAAAGLATLRYIQTHDLVTASAEKGELLGRKLRAGLADLACVGDVRGIGLMWGVELVAERASKATFPPKLHFGQRVADAAFERGLIVYPGSGCADGVSGDSLMLGPPLVITDEQIDEAIALLRQAVEAMLKMH
ncbi:MAG TPA: aminotransferase class III-fold pyridoxal phosphate-dependent enzyme [Chloroflexi bacterium]|nr:aminotransferase class III-fold pyridoxal phosphate-dependent enzyme [Chloroflexota bacterium]